MEALIDLLVLARADALVAFDFSTYGDLAALLTDTTAFVVRGESAGSARRYYSSEHVRQVCM